jgi:hypothetical protein
MSAIFISFWSLVGIAVGLAINPTLDYALAGYFLAVFVAVLVLMSRSRLKVWAHNARWLYLWAKCRIVKPACVCELSGEPNWGPSFCELCEPPRSLIPVMGIGESDECDCVQCRPSTGRVRARQLAMFFTAFVYFLLTLPPLS